MRGHVRKRGNKWNIVIYVGIDKETGKSRYKWFSGYDSQRAAEHDLPKKIQEAEAGEFSVARLETTLSSLLAEWSTDKQMQVRSTTWASYAAPLRRIEERFGRFQIGKITVREVQGWYGELIGSGLSARTVQIVHTLLHELLDRAVRWDLVNRNIAEAVELPRGERRSSSIWTPQQAAQFLARNEWVEPRYWPGMVLAVYAGLRRGEILGLQWTDVDFENCALHIQRSLAWVDGKPMYNEPKTDRGRRTVALPFVVLDILAKVKQKEGLIITRADGRPVYPRTWDDAFERAIKRADVPKIRFHDVRHTHASLLLAGGVNPKVVAERLGHSQISTTLDIYSHVLPQIQSAAADGFALAIANELANAKGRKSDKTEIRGKKRSKQDKEK